MSVVRNPKKKAADKKAASFIAGNTNGRAKGRQLKPVPVLVNFDEALLDKATRAAPEMGLNRSAFICMCVAQYLRTMNGGTEA